MEILYRCHYGEIFPNSMIQIVTDGNSSSLRLKTSNEGSTLIEGGQISAGRPALQLFNHKS
jgi:hypothetical protein